MCFFLNLKRSVSIFVDRNLRVKRVGNIVIEWKGLSFWLFVYLFIYFSIVNCCLKMWDVGTTRLSGITVNINLVQIITGSMKIHFIHHSISFFNLISLLSTTNHINFSYFLLWKLSHMWKNINHLCRHLRNNVKIIGFRTRG